jgi:predicted solute-binding protein
VSELLERQRLRNAIRLDWIASTHAPARRWPVELARTYLRDYLRFDLDARARAGAERFLREAASAGLLPACSVRWHDCALAGA